MKSYKELGQESVKNAEGFAHYKMVDSGFPKWKN